MPSLYDGGDERVGELRFSREIVAATEQRHAHLGHIKQGRVVAEQREIVGQRREDAVFVWWNAAEYACFDGQSERRNHTVQLR
jgi:hypothetical protein